MSARRLSYHLLAGGTLILIAFSLAIGLLWKEVKGSSDRVLVGQVSSRQIEHRLASLKELERSYEDNLTTLRRLDQALPSNLSSELVVVSLQSLAGRSGVTLDRIDFSRGTTPAAGPALSYALEVTGPYGAIRSFLAGINQLAPITDIADMNLTKPQKERDFLKAELQMVSYGSS